MINSYLKTLYFFFGITFLLNTTGVSQQVREVMQTRLRQWKDAGLGDHDDHVSDASAPNQAPMLAALREVHTAACALRQTATRAA